ncbi:MAG: glutamate mutase L [Lapillicoccus sp.]
MTVGPLPSPSGPASGGLLDAPGRLALCVDVGSTFTKAALVDTRAGRLVGVAEVPTTLRTDVLDGVQEVRARLGVDDAVPTIACSSAGGGLRLAVVGYERSVTAEAGYRVGLSAGARVVHVTSGQLDSAAVAALRGAGPDLVLLVGGTDGGNAEVLLHNAARLAKARLTAPVVVAGNVEVRGQVSALLASTGRRHVLADNVVPEIGVIAPDSARRAIRAAFLEHVIGGKGLSRGPAFGAMVRAATPDAVLRGVEVLAEEVGTDVIVVDIGGATTDVYSCLTPVGEDATLHKEVVAPLWHSRTVEADLGMRWNADGVVEAARREHLPMSSGLEPYAAGLAADVTHLPVGPAEEDLDLELARLAALVAVRRHGRPAAPGAGPRPLARVGLVVGSGGVLRHAGPGGRAVLAALLADHAGGWKVPTAARVGVDVAYRLFAVGLLADEWPTVARALAREIGTEAR